MYRQLRIATQGVSKPLPEREHNLANKKLRHDKEKIVNTIETPLAVLDGNGIIVAVNTPWRQFAEANGAEPGSIYVGINYLTVCNASIGPNSEGAKEMAAGIRSVLQGSNNEYVLEYRCDSPTEIRWFSARVMRLPCECESRFTVAHENITRSKLLEQRFFFARKAAKFGVWDYLVQENKLIWDEQMHALYGKSGELCSGEYQTWLSGLHPDDLARCDMEIKAALHEERAFDSEFRVLLPTGEVRYLKAKAVVLRDSSGKALRMIGVNYDITERRQIKTELEQNRQNLQELVILRTADLKERTNELIYVTNQLLTFEMRERRFIAESLHDNLGQDLIAAKLKLALIEALCDSKDRKLSLQGLKDVELLIDRSSQSVRSLSMQLNPPVLGKFGLLGALEWLSEEMRATSGLSVKLDMCKKTMQNEMMEFTLFRMVRELLVNISKHAQVSEAEIIMVIDADSGELEITVSDTGVGFDTEQLNSRQYDNYGLFSIQQRIKFIGGRMNIDSQIGEGTVVTLTLPPEIAIMA
jgi:PAS domain S-box-containing protein